MPHYIRDGKRDWDDSSKSKSPTKTIDDVTGGKEVSNEEQETCEGKLQNIVTIMEGTLWENGD